MSSIIGAGRGTARVQFFYLYLTLDLYSRKIVGWEVYAEERSALANAVLRDVCQREGVPCISSPCIRTMGLR